MQIVVSYDGKRLRTGIGESCRPAEWNKDKQQYRRSFTGYQEANDFLEKLTERLQQCYRKLRGDGVPVTNERLMEIIQPAQEPEKVVVALELSMVKRFEVFMDTMRGLGYAKNTLFHYKTVRNTLERFLLSIGKPQLPVSGYDMELHQQFIGYLREVQGLADNAVFSTVKDTKAFLRHLQNERGEVLSLDLARLNMKYAPPMKVYLRDEDLSQLAEAMLPEWMVSVRDVFLFCCYTGLRYSDVAALHGGNVHQLPDGGRVLRLTQTKTRTGVSIFLTPPAAALLDKYISPERTGPGAKVMPVRVNTAMNRALKRVAALAGLSRPVEVVDTAGGVVKKQAVALSELVSMHTARHTFAVQSLLRGLPVVVLQKVMGHAHIQTTMRYAQVVEEMQHQAMRAAWDSPVKEPAKSVLLPAATICAVETEAA